MKFSPATDFGRIKIVLNPECKIVYTLWSKNISRRFSLRKIPVKKDIFIAYVWCPDNQPYLYLNRLRGPSRDNKLVCFSLYP